MNRDLPPAVFSSYHFTSFEKDDLTGPGEGEGREGMGSPGTTTGEGS